MTWKAEHRRDLARTGLRYPSDLTDGEWALIAPLIPPARSGGRRRSVDMREIVNAIFYVLATGCPWPSIPKDLPPKSTAHGYFMRWSRRTLLRMHDALFEAERQRAGRTPQPSLGIIDAQAVAGAAKGGLRSMARGSMRASASEAASAISS